ncbi:Flp pilus assembly protein CpaB [Methylocystis sp. IM3]|uniref:Flp pilus assembly protein CpaB n=1 Tax=unclassified Methylocystis TaxID=2625913 RepID=UPI000F9BD1A3|nr:MAG: Flp pilus assembly protein CpaB [Hyphomicrobiales bacterium]
MNRAQITIISVAVASGGVAFMMMSGDTPSAPVVTPAPSAPALPLDQVLVVTRDLSYGAEVNAQDIAWIDWPKASVPAGAMTKSANPDAEQDVKSSYVRIPLSAGDPLRRERLVKGVTAGVMSTMLPAGKRAVAIDVTLNSTAGGFILPNDRVDVMRTFRDVEASKESGHDVYGSEVLLTNVRVLAIGQTVEKKSGDAVAAGPTATLELDPRQAEFILLSQRSGQLTLILRPISDALPQASEDPTAEDDFQDGTMTIVKRGAAASLRMK